MKPFKFFSLIMMMATILSCKKETQNSAAVIEVEINDFQSIAAQFKEPAKEYTTAPFFVWDAEITKEEIEKDLISFKDAGSKQVFVHPRPGLITEYLSDEWFDLFSFTVEKGKELGMNVWIYDENSYPSGFGGGHVPDQMPESFNEGQGLRMTRVEALPDTASKYFLVLREDQNGEFMNVTPAIDQEMGKTGKYLLFSKSYNGKSPWYGGYSYVDLLHQGVTEKFIEVTMTGYKKSAGAEFGNIVPGTFTDEPQINSPGGIRWTPDLFDRFRERWHYDLETRLPSLFEEVGDWKTVRHNYTQTLLDLFIERWSKPWFEYCEQQGLKFTGHYWEHEWPNMRPGGDNMAMYAWHHVPAVDMLFNQWNDSTPNAQFGNVRAIKELASAANQTGRQRKLSETYGGSGWELSFTDMKRNGDWEYALGVNLMNQHLNYFTMAGARKYDYPPTFDYHEPWWDDYRFINDHYARLSMALSSGMQSNDILVIEPTTTAWLYDSYIKRNQKVKDIGQSFQSFVTTLEKSQVEYDLGSENIMESMGDVRQKKLTVGKAAYSRVVIPPMTENLNLETYKLLEKFVAHGGTLIAFSTPGLIEGKAHPGLQEFYKKRADKIVMLTDLNQENIEKYFREDNMKLTNVHGGQLYHQRRQLSDGQLVFLVNSSLKETNSGTLTLKGSQVAELNTLTGKINKYQTENDGEYVKASWSLPPAGSLLLFVASKEIPGLQPADDAGELEVVESQGEMKVTRNDDNAIMLDFCDLETGGETMKDVHTIIAADKVFRNHGFSNGNPWNTSVQFRRSIVERDTFGANTGFTATYHFTVAGKFDYTGMKAVIERPMLWKVSVNGNEVSAEEGKWWLDRSFAVFSIGKLVRQGMNSITLTTSPMKVHAEIEPVYVLGNFSVIPAEKGWCLSAPQKEYTAVSWKNQGLPYYSWGMTYSKEFNIENSDGKWLVDAGSWNGTVAEVIVNGNKAGLIAFPPYQADISGLIKPGMNKVEIKVIGSLKNLMGPHYNNPAPGLTSPGSWRNVKSQPSGKEYQMIDYGLFGEFKLLNGR
ncbi:MAG TPA: glycosyl hydrolase [Bacteroidales bacterium]|nr:glycosyl hydrolase [Bacteroidales bacterium]